MVRFHNINGVRVQFTAAEETAWDAEESQSAIDKQAAHDRQEIIQGLVDKLSDDTITPEEQRELMRYREGLK
jgi:hypothetical protein